METLVKKELRLQTEVLKDLVGRAVKVCSFMEAFPMTSILEITVKEGQLSVKATDNVNIIMLDKNIENAIDMHLMVDAKLFSSLVSKITTPFTNLSIEDGKLVVSANGKYDIPLITEEDGSEIFLPNFDFDITVSSNHMNNFELKSILTMNKSCKAEMKEMPSLFNYYMDSERVITTDYYKACMNPVKVFNNPVCLPPTLVDLIYLVADDSGVNVQENENSVLFSSTNGVLYGLKASKEDLEAYPAQDIVNALNESFNYSCLVNKTDLISALERMCLFTEGFDSNAVSLNFSSSMLTLTTKRNNTNESVRYVTASNYDGESFTITVDGSFLKNQLASSPKEEIFIKFGNESGIELACDNIIQLSSSLDEEV